MSWYIKAIKSYADFSGRARRKEYWMFYLFNMLFVFALYLLMILFMVIGGAFDSDGITIASLIFSFIMGAYGLFVFIPSLAVLVRRLHDQGKSGAWVFISFVPFIGGIWLLVLTCMEGTVGPNQYGDDPKSI